MMQATSRLNGLKSTSHLTSHNYLPQIAMLVAIVGTTASCQGLQSTDASRQASVIQPTGSHLSTPDLRRQSTPRAVVDEHLDALNKGEWERLMAQYPADVELFLPGGVVIRGREQVGDAFRGLVKPFKDGGLFGVLFTAEHVFIVGDTVNVQWRADGAFLKEPYRGADAYVTKDGLMAAQVSTFDMTELRTLAQ